jgi:hypothetical protein
MKPAPNGTTPFAPARQPPPPDPTVCGLVLAQPLKGSGVDISAVQDDNNPQKTIMVVDVNLPQNSNMGFKLNLVAVPADGIEIEAPDGTPYMLTWKQDSFGENYLDLEEE